ncbi:MAG: aldo/keto reductase [Desulfobulbaceae bacterium]|uniref:Aldo/keto reductase n=1 Tax=Candidatus Desulfatifera sulfidica TaxID=2841691 RepID=A0A8J6N8X6_9BACT|nr:aldo/keto reductase [Candidatus Desulfatifera sulfidica]
MNSQQLGKTALSVTPLGLGLAALGRPGYINLGHADDLSHNHDIATMETLAHTVLDAAWEGGIRYFDTARSYGKAEEFLGSWLEKRDIKTTAATISSKWGYTYTADWQVNLPQGQKHEVKEHSLPVLQRQIPESKALLGNHLDIYQIHSTTLDSGVLTNEAVLKELAHLRNSGMAIGLSVTGTQQADTILRALEIEFDGALLFSTVQATWNLLEQSTTTALQTAHEAGLGVISKEGMANGRLTLRNTMPDFQRQIDLLQTLAEAQNSTIDALALAAVINQPFIDVALSGAACVAHLQSNLQALKIRWDDDLAERLRELVEPVQSYWHTRSQLAWN